VPCFKGETINGILLIFKRFHLKAVGINNQEQKNCLMLRLSSLQSLTTRYQTGKYLTDKYHTFGIYFA